MAHAPKKVGPIEEILCTHSTIDSVILTSKFPALRRQIKEDEQLDAKPMAGSEDNNITIMHSTTETTSDYGNDEDPLVWIPKKLVTEWKNKDGIRCLTLIIQLTGGAATSNSDEVEVKVSNMGEKFAISKVWSPLMFTIDDFFHLFPKAADETDDEFNRRKYAMEDKVHALTTQGNLNSIYRMSLPFQVDPTVRKSKNSWYQ